MRFVFRPEIYAFNQHIAGKEQVFVPVKFYHRAVIAAASNQGRISADFPSQPLYQPKLAYSANSHI
jgi:hypothetical protein